MEETEAKLKFFIWILELAAFVPDWDHCISHHSAQVNSKMIP